MRAKLQLPEPDVAALALAVRREGMAGATAQPAPVRTLGAHFLAPVDQRPLHFTTEVLREGRPPRDPPGHRRPPAGRRRTRRTPRVDALRRPQATGRTEVWWPSPTRCRPPCSPYGPCRARYPPPS
ncbi:acyl-CoA thioesterase domain-containing protein [Streptomyces sp. NPDC059861]|uniref:acyl-CoA thioesterase domain-containing protein n=1 Tax=Streptomyces sp. NPDC059861 TaxID=3346974 RepID=UPI00365B25CD